MEYFWKGGDSRIPSMMIMMMVMMMMKIKVKIKMKMKMMIIMMIMMMKMKIKMITKVYDDDYDPASSSVHHQFVISSSSAHYQHNISKSSAHHHLIISSLSIHHKFIIICDTWILTIHDNHCYLTIKSDSDSIRNSCDVWIGGGSEISKMLFPSVQFNYEYRYTVDEHLVAQST